MSSSGISNSFQGSHSSHAMDHYVRSYGDLLFDLCGSLLPSPHLAQLAFRAILKKIKSKSRFQKFHIYERSWVLQIACEKLLPLADQHGNSVSAAEKIEMDSNDLVANRLKHFSSYFQRLTAEDQILLLLKDKYGIPYSEISAALTVPENSLKIRRQQALRALEEWVWNHT